MERTIFEIMTDDPAKLDEFSAACDELLCAGYILAHVRISAVLKTIATSRILYSLFDRLLADFDYKAAAKNCMVENGRKIRLPQAADARAAFVFCVLLDIDKHIIELKDFLQFFAASGGTERAYNIFLAEFIAPFRDAVCSLANAEILAAEGREQQEERESERARLRLNFDRFIGTFVARINSSDLSTIVKDDLTVLCGDFSDAVHSGDGEQIRTRYGRLIKKLRAQMPPLARELERFNIETF